MFKNRVGTYSRVFFLRLNIVGKIKIECVILHIN